MKTDLTQAARLFGSKGGLAAAKNMTPEQRRARAKKGAAARKAKRAAARTRANTKPITS